MNSALPPKIRTVPSLAFFARVGLGVAVVGGLAVIFFFNPGTHTFYPTCQFHQLTGLNCPGCGATRALYELLHRHYWKALHDNALFICSGVAAVILGGRFVVQKWQNPQATFHIRPQFLWIYLAIALIFTVLRNLPAFSFLSP